MRPWHAGVLWDKDPRLAMPFFDALREDIDLTIGNNEPYSGGEVAYTINLHAGTAGLANAAVEIRQDHCETREELMRWAELLGDALERIIGMDNLHRIELF